MPSFIVIAVLTVATVWLGLDTLAKPQSMWDRCELVSADKGHQ